MGVNAKPAYQINFIFKKNVFIIVQLEQSPIPIWYVKSVRIVQIN